MMEDSFCQLSLSLSDMHTPCCYKDGKEQVLSFSHTGKRLASLLLGTLRRSQFSLTMVNCWERWCTGVPTCKERPGVVH